MRVCDLVKYGSGALLPGLLLAGCATLSEPPKAYLPAVDVPAIAETVPVGTANDDAADDPAIWRNAADPEASLIVGTDKKAGVYVYGLDGKVRDFLAAGALNNADLREVTLADGTKRILVGASDRTDRSQPRIALFWLEGTTGKLSEIGTETFLPADRGSAEAYGFCMGGALGENDLARAYVVLKDGTVVESALFEQGDRIVPAYIRDVKLATQSEGCVVDDATQTLYVAEEDVGIWKVPLQTVLKAEAYARVGAQDGLVDDVEGLAIARDSKERAWLIASSQGDNAYTLFDLADGSMTGRFRIGGGEIDGTSDTDGIEVVLGDFGPRFPEGLFIAQDGDNAPEAQNFKLLSWQSIREALEIE